MHDRKMHSSITVLQDILKIIKKKNKYVHTVLIDNNKASY